MVKPWWMATTSSACSSNRSLLDSLKRWCSSSSPWSWASRWSRRGSCRRSTSRCSSPASSTALPPPPLLLLFQGDLVHLANVDLAHLVQGDLVLPANVDLVHLVHGDLVHLVQGDLVHLVQVDNGQGATTCWSQEPLGGGWAGWRRSIAVQTSPEEVLSTFSRFFWFDKRSGENSAVLVPMAGRQRSFFLSWMMVYYLPLVYPFPTALPSLMMLR